MEENVLTKKVRHLYDLAHSTPTEAPLNAMYSARFKNMMQKSDLLLPQQLEKGKFCDFCGVVFIPVINLEMRIVFGKADKNKKQKHGGKRNLRNEERNWKPRSRKLRYTCLECRKYSEYELLQPTKDPKTNGKVDETVKEPFFAKWEPEVIKKKSLETKDKSNAKDRAKKRKKNSLSSLLSAKKEQEANEKRIGGLLSLEEFMK